MKFSNSIALLTISISAALAFAGCKDYKPEMERALMERDSVMILSKVKDSSIDTFLQTLNEIELNLDSITQNQNAISIDSKEKVEFNKDIRERINSNINIINELLEKNKSMMSSLEKKLRNSNINIASLKNMVDKLNSDIALKDQELAALNVELENLRAVVDNMNRTVDSLNTENKQKEQVINIKVAELQTAFWVKGTYKQLKASNVLNKKGGFLGIGKAKVVKQDFNNDAFTQIDITLVNRIDINNKSAKMITSHPSDSYKLEKDAKGIITHLQITDPSRFWKASKYLVIVIG
jgi:DNA repair exonuclease SbcCD ATPase subunit